MAKDIDISDIPVIPEKIDISDVPSIPSEIEKEEYSSIQQAKDFARTLAQGTTLGFSDEAIAATRALLGSTPYEQAVKEERAALEKFAEENPATAFAAELGGGLLPALFTGGASLGATAGATAAKETGKQLLKQIAKSGATGALAGGVTAYGKQTELAPDLENIASGAALGGVLGAGIPAAISGAKAIAPTTESFSKLFPRTTTAYKYAKETGKRIGSKEAAGELSESTESVMSKLKDAEKRASKSIDDLIQKKSSSGVKIGSPVAEGAEEAFASKTIPNVVKDIDEVKGYFKGDDRKIVEGFLEKFKSKPSEDIERKIAELRESDPLRSMGGISPETQTQIDQLLATKPPEFQGYSPSELHLVKQKLDALYETVKANYTISPDTKDQIKSAANKIRTMMDESLGEDYADLINRKHKLFNTFEAIMREGKSEKKAKYTGGGIGSGEKKLQASLRKMIRKSETETTSSDDFLKARETDLRKKLEELFQKEKELVENNQIKPEDSIFSFNESIGSLGDSPEELLKDITEKAKIQDARLGSIGRFKEKTGIKVATSPIQFLTSELPIDVAAVAGQLVKKGEDIASKIETKIPKVVKSGVSASADLSRSLFDLKPVSLGPISAKLRDNPETQRYGKALEDAINEENEHKKNAAIFAAMQNPKARQFISENLESLEDDLASRAPAGSSETESPSESEDYNEKRFKFITGLEGKRKSEEQHVVYRDASENRNPTIGYGFNLNAPGNKELFKQTLNTDDSTFNKVKSGELSISEKQARKLFDAAVSKASGILDQKLTSNGIDPSILSKNQRMALESLVYNSPNLLGPKILSALKAGDMKKASRLIEITSNQSGLSGLVKRRKKEADLFASGMNKGEANEAMD